MAFDEIGLQAEGVAEFGFGFGEAPPRREDGAEVAVVERIGGVGLEDAAHQVDGFGVAAGLERDLAEELYRGRRIRLAGKDLAAERFGLGGTARLAVAEGELEGRVDVHRCLGLG